MLPLCFSICLFAYVNYYLRLLQESSANLVTILLEDMGLGHQAPAYPSVNFSNQTNIKKSPKLITVRFSTKKRITNLFQQRV